MRCFLPTGVALTMLLLPPGAPASEPVQELHLIVVESEGAISNIRPCTARELIVQVQDENHRPVAGATVASTLPDQGTGGTFANGSHLLTKQTDKTGQAVARGFRPNRIQSKFEIRVSAFFQGQTAALPISQSNVLIATAAVAATHSGGSSGGSTTHPAGADRHLRVGTGRGGLSLSGCGDLCV